MYILSKSLSFQRYIKTARASMEKSLERLSSGLRVERSADDPAGMAVATSLRARLGSRRAAIRNIEDAMAMTMIADNGLAEISASLSRLREVSVQAASETIDDTSRSYLHTEAEQILNQLDITAQSASYGGRSTLSYPGVDVGLLVDTSGSMTGEILRVKESITDFQDQFLTARYNVSTGLAEYRSSTDNLDNTTLLTDIGDTTLLSDLDDIVITAGGVDPYAALTETTGITDIEGQTDPDSFSFREGTVKVIIMITDSLRQADFLDGAETQADVADWLADKSIQVHAITPPAVSGDYSTIASVTGGDIHDIGNSGGSNISTALDDIATSIIDQLDQAEPRTFLLGIHATDVVVTPFPLDMSVVGLSLDELDLTTTGTALAALDSIDLAIQDVGEAMGKVGGMLRRLDSAMSTQITSQESETYSLSTIVDLDYAKESTMLAASQIRMSASLAAMTKARALDEEATMRLLSE